MKRALILLIATLFAATVLASCTLPAVDTGIPDPDDDRLQVIATVFPQYDFIRQIAGDRVALRMLISPGAESHSFDPAPRDMVALNHADLLVYVGGHGDEWVERILETLDNDNLRTVAMLDMIDELISIDDHDYAQDHYHSHDHSHDHGHDHDDHEEEHDDSHDHEYDEHVWTSPHNAISIVRELTAILSEMDLENAEYFRANAESYVEELIGLTEAFSEVVNESVRNTVIFADRFPFRYLMTTFGLNARAAFPGCSAETQASPGDIALLIGVIDAERIPVIFTIEFSNQQIANAIAQDVEGDVRILELHSAHNLSAADFNAGVTYVDIMMRNVENLREALS